MTLHVECALGYHGSPLEYSKRDTVITVVGNALRFFDLRTGKQTFLWGADRGISTFAVNHVTNLVAYATKGTSPIIYVHDMTTHQLLEKYTAVAELEVGALAFSRTGDRFVTVAKEPCLKLIVWGVENGEKVVETVAAAEVESITVNPADSDLMCAQGNGICTIYEVDKCHKTLSINIKPIDTEGRVPICHQWFPGGYLYLGCEGGEIIVVNAKTCAVVPCMGLAWCTLDSPVCSLAVHRDHLVAATLDGVLRFMKHANLPEPEELQQIAEIPLVGDAAETELEVTTMAYNTHYTELCLVTSEATMYQIVLNNQDMTELRQNPGGEYGAQAYEEPSFACVNMVAEYHCGAVTGMVGLPTGEHFATCGEDGTLRIWSAREQALVHKRIFSSQQTALAVSTTANMLALGSSEGVLRLLAIMDGGAKESPVVFRCRLHAKGAVKLLAFAPSGLFVASMGEDGCLFIVATGMAFSNRAAGAMYFTAEVPEVVRCMTWDARDKVTGGQVECDGPLLFSTEDAGLISFQPPLVDVTVGRNMELSSSDIFMRRMRLEAPLDCMLTLPRTLLAEDHPTELLALAADKDLKRFVLPQDTAGWGGAASRVREPEYRVMACNKRGAALGMSANSKYVLTGATDGVLAVRSASDWTGATVKDRLLNDSYLGGITHAALGGTQDNYVMCGGADGTLFLLTANGMSLADQYFPILTEPTEDVDVQAYDDPAEMTVVEVSQQTRLMMGGGASAQNAPAMATKADFEELKKRFDVIMDQNEAAPFMEKLEYKEFVIDYELKEKLEAEGAKMVVLLQGEINRQNLEMGMVSGRIKVECWDKMVTQARFLTSLKTGQELHNFPIRKKPKLHLVAQKVMFLRGVEQLEAEYHKAEELANAPPPEAPSPGEEAIVDEEKEEEEKEEEEVGTACDQLIYDYQTTICPMQKRSQSILLRLALQERKEAYNVKLEALRQQKLHTMDRVSDLNERVVEIANELGLVGKDYPRVSNLELDAKENEASVLEVRDEDVPFEKYVNPVELAARVKKEKEDEERRKLEAGQDVGERALKHMMGGKLESNKADGKMTEMLMPEWMAGDRANLNEDQHKQIKEWELKKKQFDEEMDKYKKTLDAELKKLRADAKEAVVTFDETLATFYLTTQIKAQSSVFEIEMQIINLGISLEQQLESDEVNEKAMADELESLKTAKGKSAALLAEFSKELNLYKDMHEQLLADDKAMEKSFKRDFAACEEFVDLLYRMFKRRAKGKADTEEKEKEREREEVEAEKMAARQRRRRRGSLSEMDHPVGMRRMSNDLDTDQKPVELNEPQRKKELYDIFHSMGEAGEGMPNDAFTGAVHSKDLSHGTGKLVIEPLTEGDKPEECPREWWERMLEVREQKIQSEAEGHRVGNVLKEMTRYHTRIFDGDEKTNKRVELLLRQLSAFREARLRNMYDLDIPLHVKQGQVEVPDMSLLQDAVFLHRSAVEEENEVIKRHGGDKLVTLTAIKDFKKGIYDVQWLNVKYEMDMVDLTNTTRELQLLRMTKELQVIMKNGSESNANSREAHMLEARVEHNKKLHEKRAKDLAGRGRKINRILQDRQAQNDEIQGQIYEIGSHVAEQLRIRQGTGGVNAKPPGIPPEKKMRSLVTHRKLMDISRAQSQEMLLLREELERLRLRTFPSFVEKRPTGNPDDLTYGGINRKIAA